MQWDVIDTGGVRSNMLQTRNWATFNRTFSEFLIEPIQNFLKALVILLMFKDCSMFGLINQSSQNFTFPIH